MDRYTITLDRIADLTESDHEGLRALSLAVYPPTHGASWPGRQIEWVAAEWCVRVRADEGAAVSYVGITLREALEDDRPVRIGGIGGVKTHPARRGQGLAARAMERADQFFREEAGVDFGLLVCGPHLLDHYSHLGWREFPGRLMVRQHGATVEFTFNRVMTRAARSPAPEAGTIDLLGPPW